VLNTMELAKRLSVLGPYYKNKGNLFEHQAVSAAIQNILLCAEQFHLGAVWLGSPVFVRSGIERILKVESELCAVLALGYYDQKPRAVSRLPVDEIYRVMSR